MPPDAWNWLEHAMAQLGHPGAFLDVIPAYESGGPNARCLQIIESCGRSHSTAISISLRRNIGGTNGGS